MTKKGFTLISRACCLAKSKACKGFTLIELLVVISIIGVLMALSFFGLQGARVSSRDSRREADLETIRSGLEIYRSDCNVYPAAITGGSALVGSGSPTTCASSNTYISLVPKDPLDPSRKYLYARLTSTTYELCTSLEGGGTTVTCGGSKNCGTDCNYKVTNP